MPAWDSEAFLRSVLTRSDMENTWRSGDFSPEFSQVSAVSSWVLETATAREPRLGPGSGTSALTSEDRSPKGPLITDGRTLAATTTADVSAPSAHGRQPRAWGCSGPGTQEVGGHPLLGWFGYRCQLLRWM